MADQITRLRSIRREMGKTVVFLQDRDWQLTEIGQITEELDRLEREFRDKIDIALLKTQEKIEQKIADLDVIIEGEDVLAAQKARQEALRLSRLVEKVKVS